MKRAADHLAELARSLPVHRVYADLDGTLLGPGGSLFAHPDGATEAAAGALVAMARAGIGLVLVSGRTRQQVGEVARVVGAAAYVAEIGGLIVHRQDGQEVETRNPGAYSGSGTPFDAMMRSGAAGYLLTEFAGRLEPHAPWSNLPRECSVLLRGLVAVDEVRAALVEGGYGWLDLLDNGVIAAGPERFPALDGPEVRVYHLAPRGVGKAPAIAIDRDRLGLDPTECIVVGDAPSDVAAAGEVGAVFVVANGGAAVADLPVPDNVYLLERSHGLGFADAVEAFAVHPAAPPSRP
ncbi:MAG TPA: HAD hydrolase family protein [Actinomycetota bacterium]|nr:HAD hydrolase family protein [Actinomycetota bacterium]